MPPPNSPQNDAPLESGAVASQNDELLTILNYCTAAQIKADAMGEKLLTYLLSMAAEETRTTIRRRTVPSSDRD